MQKEVEERTLHRMAKVHNFLENWQGSQNLRATQKESRVLDKQMTAVGYILVTEEIVKAFWSLIQHHGAAAFKLLRRSPLLPALCAKNLPGGWTQIINVRLIWGINHHPVESDEENVPESISDTESWPHWNGDLDNPNVSADECVADNESDIEHNTAIEDPECAEQQDVSAAPTVPGLVRPPWKSKRQAGRVLVTVNAIETRRNSGVKKKKDRMRQWYISFFMWLEREFRLEIWYGRMVRSSLRILVDKEMYSRRIESFGEKHHFLSCESEQCMNIIPLSFAAEPSLHRTERQPIRLNHDENNYRQ